VAQAKQLIDDAISEWAGSSEEVEVLMANSEIQLDLGDIKKALDILKTVDPQSSNFAQSRKLMADIYLKHLKDRRHFAKCYVDLIEVYKIVKGQPYF
jgi:tetratricopeptide repeat protein 21B